MWNRFNSIRNLDSIKDIAQGFYNREEEKKRENKRKIMLVKQIQYNPEKSLFLQTRESLRAIGGR